MRTIEEITDGAIGRRNPHTYATGYLTRQDIFDYIDVVGKDKAADELPGFLETLPFLSSEDRKKVLGDLASYGL